MGEDLNDPRCHAHTTTSSPHRPRYVAMRSVSLSFTISMEYPLLREALGQLLTVEEVGEDDVLVAAVPKAATFSRLAGEWGDRPLMRRVGIRIVLVGRDGAVEGLDL